MHDSMHLGGFAVLDLGEQRVPVLLVELLKALALLLQAHPPPLTLVSGQ